MAIEAERLLAIFEAKFDSLDKAVAKSRRETQKGFADMEASGKRLNTTLQGVASRGLPGMEKVSADLRKTRVESDAFARSISVAGRTLGAVFGGALSIRGAQQLIDTATRIRNALKVTGLEGESLTKVYDALYQSAQKNATPLESLVTLYSRVAQAQDSLGVSQAQIINFTDKIGVALRVAGTGAQEASGALLQLSQALGSGTVRAEEFNSINEGARPILQAVAAGLEEAGGSVSRLRQLVLDGQVSSEAFFRAFEAGAPMLEEKVKSAETTTSAAFVRLQNVLVDVAGRLDAATGASGRVGDGLYRLAGIVEGVGKVIEAVANGPVGTMIAKLDELNQLLQKIEPLSRGLAALDNIGSLAPLIAPSPAPTGLQAQIDAKRAEIARLEDGLAKINDSGTRAKVADLQREIAELQQDLRNAKDKDQLYSGSRGASTTSTGGPMGGPAISPIKLSDYPVGGGAAGGSDASAKLIRRFEGFRTNAYWDVNHFRVGFGSDTATRANGMIEKVTRDTVVTLADAERDLTRRITEFQSGIKAAVGIEAWKSLSEQQQAALTSVAYNYGTLPKSVAESVRRGDSPADTAKAIAGLSKVGRRREEAQAYLSGTGISLGDAGISGSRTKTRTPDDIFQGSVEQVQQRIALMNAEIEAQRGLTAGVDDYGFAVEKARIKQDLLNDAKRAGLEVTPELAGSIDTLAENYARASANAEQLAKSQANAAQASQEFAELGRDALGGFIRDLMAGKSASEALANALSKVGDRLLDMALDSLFSGGSGGGNFLSAIFGGIFGGGSKIADPWSGLRGFATGTTSAPRGLARMNERGRGEIVDLKGGERIYPHDVSMQMAKAVGSRGGGRTFAPTYNIDARGSTMSEGEFRRILNDRDRKIEGKVRSNVFGWVSEDQQRLG